jgi:hypothetical protein
MVSSFFNYQYTILELIHIQFLPVYLEFAEAYAKRVPHAKINLQTMRSAKLPDLNIPKETAKSKKMNVFPQPT